MLGFITEFVRVSESNNPGHKPFEVELKIKAFVTRKEMAMLQTVMIQNLPISAISCNKLQRQSKNEGRNKI